MGFLEKLFGKKNTSKADQTIQDKDIALNKMTIQPVRTSLSVHPDISGLLWIGDGKFKNYTPTPAKRNIIRINGIPFTISFGEEDEPSLILLRLPIANASGAVERPPYYPTYRGLTPEQRGIYWKLLANPYDSTVDIGYVFILYYGLERYLLTDQYEEAINVILKLRDVHSNKSFQMYTANAVILTCLYRQRADIVQRFMNSLDKEYEFSFSSNLFLLCKYSLGLPLTAADVMRMTKAFEFTKNNYIKKYPDMFLQTLTQSIVEQYKQSVIPWDKILSNTEFRKLSTEEIPVFANVSIIDNTINVPSLLSSFKLKKSIYDLLDKAYEGVKKQLATMKKEGVIVPDANQPPAKTKEVLTIDSALERKLLSAYNAAKKDSMEQHFASISLQDFYYKYREVDTVYLEKCIEYCQDDISRLYSIQKAYCADERKRILSYTLLTKEEKQQRLTDIAPFSGSIPAFKRLAIIYEKRKEYQNAIDICEQAIAYYNTVNLQTLATEFIERKNKLLGKKS